MNQPTIDQRITKLEQRVDNIERLEQKLDFNQRDVSYKTDMAQSFMRSMYESVQDVKEQQRETNQRLDRLEKRMDGMDSKLDLILQLLQPRLE